MEEHGIRLWVRDGFPRTMKTVNSYNYVEEYGVFLIW